MHERACVRYERLRPAEIVARRRRCPVAYLPLGVIEWHGEHNPVGLDALKITALLEKCAEAIGGLVLPPLYYGENRERSLSEATSPDRFEIAQRMDLPAANFDPGYMMTTPLDQDLNYLRLLLHAFSQIRSLGFQLLVVGAGHYPLLDHARAAAALFHETQTPPKMIVWAMSGYELLGQRFSPCGDHGGKYETSLLMYLEPGLVDLQALPKEGAGTPVGVTANGVEDSNQEFGGQVVQGIIEEIAKRVAHFLENSEFYQGPGAPV